MTGDDERRVLEDAIQARLSTTVGELMPDQRRAMALHVQETLANIGKPYTNAPKTADLFADVQHTVEDALERTRNRYGAFKVLRSVAGVDFVVTTECDADHGGTFTIGMEFLSPLGKEERDGISLLFNVMAGRVVLSGDDGV